ncbi:MAG: 6-pyruvoyl trahydropterin synthase family protein [Gemmatimonadales bacterium]
MEVTLSRTLGFRASHRYWKPAWGPEANRSRFGAATEPHWHDYTCTVTVRGPLDPDTDMVLDLAMLDQILAREITGRLDGRALDRDVPEFAGGRTLPTCEALARDLFTRIAPALPAGVVLERVRVAEDVGVSAEAVSSE